MSKALASMLPDAGKKYIGRTYQEMDCQRFVETCMKDCGVREDLPGSNAWYRRMNWVGTPEECKAKYGVIPKGAFLYILEQNGKEPEKYKADGIGNASHIGIYTGEGKGALDSSKSRGLVGESYFKGKTVRGGWNRVGLWTDRFDYDGVNATAPGGASMETQKTDPMPVTTATVWAENGLPVKMRYKPGNSLYENLPVGTVVNVVEKGGNWTKVNYTPHQGWYIMTKYLRFEDEKPAETPGVTIEITGLTESQAEELIRQYPQAIKSYG